MVKAPSLFLSLYLSLETKRGEKRKGGEEKNERFVFDKHYDYDYDHDYVFVEWNGFLSSAWQTRRNETNIKQRQRQKTRHSLCTVRCGTPKFPKLPVS